VTTFKEGQRVIVSIRDAADYSGDLGHRMHGRAGAIEKGKLEVEAFIATALHKVGIRAIRDAGGTLLLGDGEDEKKP
jgi:hypothetical protein